METKYHDIASLLRTTYDVQRFLEIVDTLIERMYMQERISPDVLGSLFGKPIGSKIAELLTQQQIDLADTGAVKDFFENMLAYLKKARIVQITLAVTPDEALLGNIHTWLMSLTAGETVFIDLKIDPKIRGGLQLAYEGRYWDMSLNTQMDHFFKTQTYGFSKVA